MSVAKMIKEIRKEKGLTQVQMADAIEVSLPSLKRFEANNVTMPGRETIINIANLAGVHPAEIVRKVWFDYDDLSLEEKMINNYFHVETYTQSYLAYEYMNGYNVEIGKSFMIDILSEVRYKGYLTKTKETLNKFIVDDFSSEKDILEVTSTPENCANMIFRYMNTLSWVYSDIENLKEFRLILDSTNNDHVAAFDRITKIRINIIKINVLLILFDPKQMVIVNSCSISKNKD